MFPLGKIFWKKKCSFLDIGLWSAFQKDKENLIRTEDKDIEFYNIKNIQNE